MLVWITVRLRQDPPSSPSALLSASNGLDESAAECGPLEHASVINHTRQTALFCKVFH